MTDYFQPIPLPVRGAVTQIEQTLYADISADEKHALIQKILKHLWNEAQREERGHRPRLQIDYTRP